MRHRLLGIPVTIVGTAQMVLLVEQRLWSPTLLRYVVLLALHFAQHIITNFLFALVNQLELAVTCRFITMTMLRN
jgi:hypothetical protein